MSPGVATVIFVVGILGLFALDRDRNAQTSKALWIPIVWLLIIASRPVSAWLGNWPPPDELPEQLLEGNSLDGVVFAVLCAVGLVVLASRGRRVGALLRANRPILLFYLYCAASILWSDYPFVAFKRWIKFVADLVMVLIVLTESDPRAAVRRFLTRTGFLLVPLSVLLIRYYPEGRVYDPWTWAHSWVGAATDKNSLGMDCMIFGLASLWCFLQESRGGEGRRRVGPSIAHGTVLLMVLWLFSMINSMTSLSAFVLAGGLMVAARTILPTRRPTALHLLVATITSVSLAAVFLNAGDLVRVLGRDPTLTGRRELWHQLLGMTVNPLVGAGFESFWLGERLKKLWSIYWWHPNEAHNGYLEVFLNLGWVGVVLLAVVLVAGYRNAIVAFRRDRWTASLKLAYFVAAVTFNFTEAGFKMTDPVWLAFILAATAGAEAPVGADAHIPDRVRVRRDQFRAAQPAAKLRRYEGTV